MKDTIVFAYARMNPPTIGHLKLIQTVKRQSIEHGNAPYRIVISRKHDNDKNPLDPESKMQYIREFFPEVRFTMADDEFPSFAEHLIDLAQMYKNLIFVTGSDRYTEYLEFIMKYNGSAFTFDTTQVVNAGERSNQSRIGRASGTLARSLVRHGDLRGFFNVMPTVDNAYRIVDLYDELRETMGINTSDEEGTHEEKEPKEV